MLRVVFDTVVFVRCLINPHGRWGALVFEHAGRYRLFVSEPVLVEILEVLARPELTKKFRSLRGLDRTRVLDLLAQASVVELPAIPPVSRDPKDDKFLATARAARAQYLVSEDEDLLHLGEYEGIKMVNALQFLRILEQEDGQGEPQPHSPLQS